MTLKTFVSLVAMMAFSLMAQNTITVQPNATQAVSASGKSLAIVSATGSFKVEMDQGGQNTGATGSVFAADKPFSRLVFTDISGAANTITYDATTGTSPGVPAAITKAGPTFVGPNSNLYNLGGTSKIFQGVDSQGRHRKSIYITNTGRDGIGGNVTTALVMVLINSTQTGYIFPATNPVRIDTDAEIVLESCGADLSLTSPTVFVSVLEIFNSQPQ